MNTETSTAPRTVRTLDLTRFKEAVGIIVQCKCQFGNTRNAKKEKISLTATTATDTSDTAEESELKNNAAEIKAKTRMTLKKQLIKSPEYDAIKSFQNEIRTWLYSQTVPSFFKEGFALASLASVEIIDKRLKKAIGSLPVPDEEITLPKLVARFQAAYPAQVEEARTVLEPVGQFNPLDYPSASEFAGMFRIEWNWVAFQTPEGLPAELRQQEQEKLNKQMTDAADQITQALRAGMLELITHATETLKPGADGKKKIFRDSLTGNITDFLETFQRRNITNDIELAQLVSKAKDILKDVTPEKLRQMDNVRSETAAKFDAIKTELSALVTIQPSRAFDLSDE